MKVLTSKFADDVREAYLDEIQLEKQEGITNEKEDKAGETTEHLKNDQ